MSKNVDLTSKEWCDLVFEGKNKAFGGYLLRVNSPKRYTWATVGVICVVAFFIIGYFVAYFMIGKFKFATPGRLGNYMDDNADVLKSDINDIL